jgi:hypothetical protein
MYNDDEATEFEMSPLGARQRMLPTRTFLSRLPAPVPAPFQAPPMAEASAVLIYPPEIHYPDAIDELVSSSMRALSASSSMSAALPIASRRFRWIAVPLISMLALVALGGAMWHPDEVQGRSIAPAIASSDENIAPPSSRSTAAEDPAPIEEAPAAKPVVKSTAKRMMPKPRKVTVNSSSALGNLRPRKAW